MKVSVCDDNKEFHVTVKRALREVQDEKEISSYYNGENLLKAANQGEIPDILFLDIEMEGKSGLETAALLRQRSEHTIIIFASCHPQYVFQSFYVNAFYYLVKPVGEEAIRKEFDRAVKEYQKLHSTISIHTEKGPVRIEIKDIYYISSYYRTIHLFTKKEHYQCDGKLNVLEYMLSDKGFVRCHQGFLVNMQYIKEIGEKKMILHNGIEIDISARKRTDVKRKYNKYILGEIL